MKAEKLKQEYWTDGNGGKHALYTVRSLGPSQGFGILHRYRAMFVEHGFATREEAWARISE